jgi:hypothetical protein
MIFVIFFLVATALAEPEITKNPVITNTSILFWAKEQPIDWFSGIALAITGLMGALVTIFFLVGGVVPGTAGQVEIDNDTLQLKEYKEKLKKLWDKEQLDEVDLKKANELNSIVNDFNTRLDKERRYQFSLAATLYAVLGAFIATILAHDILQAFVIGAGWTGYLGALGLKQDAEKRKSEKDKTIDSLIELHNNKEREGATKGEEDIFKADHADEVVKQAKRARNL